MSKISKMTELDFLVISRDSLGNHMFCSLGMLFSDSIHILGLYSGLSFHVRIQTNIIIFSQ